MKSIQSKIKGNTQGTKSDGKEAGLKSTFWNKQKKYTFNWNRMKKTRIQKNEERLRNLQDNFKHSKI